jgi:hypothetical protein
MNLAQKFCVAAMVLASLGMLLATIGLAAKVMFKWGGDDR